MNTYIPALLLLALALPVKAQDSLFAPQWLANPVQYKENNFSASACARIKNGDEMLARSSALDIARKEIGLYLQGFDPSNPGLAQQLFPKIYMSESAVWLREGDSRDFCVLASMNYRDLSNASNSGVEVSDFKKIQERFSLLTQLGANGQDRERRADEAKIAELEQTFKKWRQIKNDLRAIRFTQIEYLRESGYKFLFQFDIKNGSSWDISSVDIVLKLFKGNRKLPIYSNEVELKPLGGIQSGEKITAKEALNLIDFSRVRLILESPDGDLRWEAHADRAYDPGGNPVDDWTPEDLQNSRSMGQLRQLKAKWQIE